MALKLKKKKGNPKLRLKKSGGTTTRKVTVQTDIEYIIDTEVHGALILNSKEITGSITHSELVSNNADLDHLKNAGVIVEKQTWVNQKMEALA